jgi:peptidoglycan hydrolase-like protein with peptidoglycan-binding domain
MPHPRARVPACALLAVAAGLALPASASAAFGDRTLQRGDEGHDVRVLQSWLTKLGIATRVDGVFGRGTELRLRRFERREEIAVDGRLSPADARLMRRMMRERARGTGGTKAGELPPQPVGPPGRARVSGDGRTAIAPSDAPPAVKRAIAYANRITRKPYRYGGGHGSFHDSGYDCSGAVSYALRGARLLRRPMDSSELMSWGRSGAGRWITVYSNPGHAYAVIAGLRFDTSGRGESGPRWRREARSSSGYRVRHWPGL